MNAKVDPDDSERLDRVLDEWLDRMASERAEPAALLAGEPDWAADARPLLLTARQLNELDLAPLSRPAVEAIRDRVLAQCDAARSAKAPSRRWLLWARLASVSVVVLLLFAVALIGAWRVSADSLPGSSAYAVKRAFEDLRIVLAASPAERAALHTTYALRRVDEALKVGAGDDQLRELALLAASHHLAQARENIVQAGRSGVPISWDLLATLSGTGERELTGASLSSQAALQAREELRELSQLAGRRGAPKSEESRPVDTAAPELTARATHRQPGAARPLVQPTLGRNLQSAPPATVTPAASRSPAPGAMPTRRPDSRRMLPTAPPATPPTTAPAPSATAQQPAAHADTATPEGSPPGGRDGSGAGQPASGGGSGGESSGSGGGSGGGSSGSGGSSGGGGSSGSGGGGNGGGRR